MSLSMIAKICKQEVKLNRRHIMIPTVWHCGEGKHMETVKRPVDYQKLKREGKNRQNTGFLAQWTYCIWYSNGTYITLCTCPNPPGLNPNVNYGLWEIVMSWCRFINFNKYTALVGDVNNGGGYILVGTGISLYLSLNFIVLLKKIFKTN